MSDGRNQQPRDRRQSDSRGGANNDRIFNRSRQPRQPRQPRLKPEKRFDPADFEQNPNVIKLVDSLRVDLPDAEVFFEPDRNHQGKYILEVRSGKQYENLDNLASEDVLFGLGLVISKLKTRVCKFSKDNGKGNVIQLPGGSSLLVSFRNGKNQRNRKTRQATDN
jgi:hypothetical protein